MPVFFDTHTHLHLKEFRNDLSETIRRARDAGVRQMVTLGTDVDSSRETLAISRKYQGIYAAVGIHPSDADKASHGDYEAIRKLAVENKEVVAIGEIGLDFYWKEVPAEAQYPNFRKMLDLGCELNLPVVIHNRNAHREMEWFFQEEGIHELNGVMHCFSGQEIDARFYLEMGMHLSFTGNITYPQFNMEKIVRFVPLDRVMIETDCPYISPEPVRKKRNEPAHLRYTAQKMAEIHRKSLEQIAEITTRNACRFFGLPE